MLCLSAARLAFSRSLLCLILLLTLLPGRLAAQGFKPGEIIEYKVYGSYPATWERGAILREIEGGKQYLVREKPSQFYPDGFERAYYPTDLRPLKAGAATAPAKTSAPPAGQGFKPGEVIEYKVYGSYPETWERGAVLREIEGGKQYLVREKPSQFYPDGFERAYSPADLRPLKAGATTTPTPPANPPAPVKTPAPPTTPPANKPPATVNAPPPAQAGAAVPAGQGLLTKAQVIGFAKQLFGEGNAFGNPQREALLDQIRDLIKTRGVDFAGDNEFWEQMNKQGTYSIHIGSAVTANYGPPPKLEDYYGTFHLRVANRGSKSEKREGSRVIVTTSDSQHESGALTINPDGTYVWKAFRGDPPEKWLKGKWRVMKPEEMHKWEGGPALWLEKAKQGEDYTMRMGRVPGWPGWIDVGMGIGRSPVEYGRRP